MFYNIAIALRNYLWGCCSPVGWGDPVQGSQEQPLGSHCGHDWATLVMFVSCKRMAFPRASSEVQRQGILLWSTLYPEPLPSSWDFGAPFPSYSSSSGRGHCLSPPGLLWLHSVRCQGKMLHCISGLCSARILRNNNLKKRNCDKDTLLSENQTANRSPSFWTQALNIKEVT